MLKYSNPITLFENKFKLMSKLKIQTINMTKSNAQRNLFSESDMTIEINLVLLLDCKL